MQCYEQNTLIQKRPALWWRRPVCIGHNVWWTSETPQSSGRPSGLDYLTKRIISAPRCTKRACNSSHNMGINALRLWSHIPGANVSPWQRCGVLQLPLSPINVCTLCYTNTALSPAESILTWYRGYRDHEGGSPRARPFHCTTIGLTRAITPNVGDSSTLFLVVGDCVRAIPW